MTETLIAPPAVWPRQMRRAMAALYLKEVHGIQFEEKTLANRNARGLAPKPQFLGTIPYYTLATLDEFAATAFTDESPVTVMRRKIAARIEAEKRRARRKPAQYETTAATT